ncbi:hypothetical protein D039_0437A, partial [Vibrio parahaemolyticus EKP-028]
MFSEYLTGCFS